MPINVKDFAQRVEGMANILGAYIESSLKDKGQIDQQLKGLAKGIEDYVAQAVAERLKKDMGPQEIELKVKTLPHFKGDLPSYQSEGASGFDVCAQIDNTVTLEPGARLLVPTGLSFEIPQGYEIQVRPRSGWAIKKGISVVNTPGTVDADYRGEVKVILVNLGQEHVDIEPQQRIAQMVVCPVVQANMTVVDDLSETERGAGGFGSTGLGQESSQTDESAEAAESKAADNSASDAEGVVH